VGVVSVELRPIEAGEVGSWFACIGSAFFQRSDERQIDPFAALVDLDRTLGVFDDGRIVATLRSFATELTVPGCVPVAASAVTAVAVEPAHRRRGLLRMMMTADLDAAAARGEPLSVLIASEWPIYGRYGYGPAVDGADYELDTRAARFLSSAPGAVELVDAVVALEQGPPLYDRVRRRVPGAIERSQHWWQRNVDRPEPLDPGRAAGAPSWCALYRSPAGEVEGMVRYHVEASWQAMRPDGRLHVDDLIAATPAAQLALWRFAAEMDLATEVRARRRPVDEPVAFWLADGRALRRAERYDLLWVRVLDVPAALASRRYGASGDLVLEVDDPLGHAAGRYRLEAGPEGAHCARCDGGTPADLLLGVEQLGSIYLGGVSPRRLAEAGRLTARDDSTLELAGRLFQTLDPPWCPTFF
jgi:predicted acetyltransferase